MNIHEQRRRLAFEAARLMARDGISDARQARHKAARLLGITDKAALPDDGEIHSELRQYQKLFGKPEANAHALRLMREAALNAMAFFKHFEPRLAGTVLAGTAVTHAVIMLHLHSDDFEQVPRFLVDASIPAKAGFMRLCTDPDHRGDFPLWSFIADGQPFELLVLPLDSLRQAPLDADGKPMRRASAAALAMLLAEDDAGTSPRPSDHVD